MNPETATVNRILIVQDEAGVYLASGRPPEGIEIEIREFHPEMGTYTRVWQPDGDTRLGPVCKQCGHPWVLKDRKCSGCLEGDRPC